MQVMEESSCLEIFHRITEGWLSAIFSQYCGSRDFIGQVTIQKLFGISIEWIDSFNSYLWIFLYIKGTVGGPVELNKIDWPLSSWKDGSKIITNNTYSQL